LNYEVRLLSSFRIAVTAFSAVLVPLTFSQSDARIQDNSFLVEEAYNQEFGVVQHISNFVYLADSKVQAKQAASRRSPGA
jgi:hypothetical protein